MRRPPIGCLILTLITLVLISSTSQATAKDQRSSSSINRAAYHKKQVLSYSMLESRRDPALPQLQGKVPLGTSSLESSLTASPGVTIGWTYWDLQQASSMGRMIAVGPHSGVTGPAAVHFGWTHLPDSAFIGRTYMYNAYRTWDGFFAGTHRLHDYDEEYSGYVNVHVTPDNRAIVGGQKDEKGPAPYQPHIHYDLCSTCELFLYEVRVPDSLADYEQTTADEAMWPKFFFQIGIDTVLHIIARMNETGQPMGAIMYFRKVGYEGSSGGWSYPPYVVDSVQAYSHDITGVRGGDRVAISWMAGLPCQQPECDTCSGLSIYDPPLGEMDNDLYCQISEDQGMTWMPRVNVTQAGLGEQGYRAYPDLSMLFDASDNLHVVWTANPWPADACWETGGYCFEDAIDLTAARLFHWSENIPYVRTISDHTYEPVDSCGPPLWALRVAKPSIAECDGNLYVIWTQFNDITTGIIDDCAEWVYVEGGYWGGANGDLWYAGSPDGGMTWGTGVNLTNSYTPRCDPWGGENCQNDYWGSMISHGRMVETGENWTGAEIVDLGGGPSDYYLDIMYLNDLDAGIAVEGQGSWINSPVKWFRIPCVWVPPPPPCPPLVSPPYIGDPTYTKPGEQLDVSVEFANWGTTELLYTVECIEDDGPAGWLTVSGLDGVVPNGLYNVEEGTIHLNSGGIITTTGNYHGRLHFEFACYGEGTHDLEIELIVADTLVKSVWDTLSTNCLSLTISNNGNMGRDGQGTVNMDYYPVDCDTFAIVYLYDGSPFVGRIIGGDTVFSWAIFGAGYLDESGFRPLGGQIEAEYCETLDAEVFESGVFTSQDSTLAIEKIWVAPQGNCEFIVQHTRLWSLDGMAHGGLMLGEAIDWDVPWDYLPEDENHDHTAVNTGGVDGTRWLLYQQGYEAYGLGSDTGYPFNCQYNDERFAGHAFIESYLNGTSRADIPYGGFVGENDRLVYPADDGFVPGLFYQESRVSGLRGSDSTEDLFSAMTFEPSLDLSATDVYEAVTVLATIQQGALVDLQAAIDAGKAWYTSHGGINMFADDNNDGRIDPCDCCCRLVGDIQHDLDIDPLDVVALVDWLWRGGPPPQCLVEANINCDCSVDPQDALIYMNWMWRGGPWPGCECSYVCSCP